MLPGGRPGQRVERGRDLPRVVLAGILPEGSGNGVMGEAGTAFDQAQLMVELFR